MTRTTIISSILTATLASAVLSGPASAGESLSYNGNSVTYTYTAKDAQEAQMLKFGLQAWAAQTSGGSITQQGTMNAAGLSQNGKGNIGVISQIGNGNTGTLTQNGNNNAYGLFQFGNGSNAAVTQTGNGQAGITVQGGL